MTDLWAPFREKRYINLTTFRKNGKAVSTPVWFVLLDDRMYVWTGRNTGKVKRVRANGRAQIAPSDARGRPLGPSIPVRARIVADPDLHRRVERAFLARYGCQYRLIGLLYRVRGSKVGEPVVIELTPEPQEEAENPRV